MSIITVHGPTMLGQGGVGPGGGPPGDNDPSLTSIAPPGVLAEAGATLLTLTGNDFVAGSVIEIDQVAVPTTFVNSTTLTTSFDPSVPGRLMFSVRNPNAEESNSRPFIVAGEGDPQVTSISPNTVLASAGATEFTIRGLGFDADAKAEFGGPAVPTVFVNSTTLTATFDPSVAGPVNVTVRNEGTGLESNDMVLTVTAGQADPQIPDPEPEAFHPNDHIIDEVKDYIENLVGTDDWILGETQRVLDLERAFQNRTTLVAWLDARCGVN